MRLRFDRFTLDADSDRIERAVSMSDGDELRLGPVAVTFRMVPADSSTETVTTFNAGNPRAVSRERQGMGRQGSGAGGRRISRSPISDS